MCPTPMTDIMTCSISEVVVTQLPVRAVLRPSTTDIDEIRKAKCIETAFTDGLAMETPPAPAINTPNRRGNRAVTYSVVTKKAIPRVPNIPPVMIDSCGMLKPAMVYLAIVRGISVEYIMCCLEVNQKISYYPVWLILISQSAVHLFTSHGPMLSLDSLISMWRS